MRQRVERLEGNMGGGAECPECGGGGRGPVRLAVHHPDGDDCPSCDGPCLGLGPEFCPGCGRSLRCTLVFDFPIGLEVEGVDPDDQGEPGF